MLTNESAIIREGHRLTIIGTINRVDSPASPRFSNRETFRHILQTLNNNGYVNNNRRRQQLLNNYGTILSYLRVYTENMAKNWYARNVHVIIHRVIMTQFLSDFSPRAQPSNGHTCAAGKNTNAFYFRRQHRTR